MNHSLIKQDDIFKAYLPSNMHCGHAIIPFCHLILKCLQEAQLDSFSEAETIRKTLLKQLQEVRQNGITYKKDTLDITEECFDLSSLIEKLKKLIQEWKNCPQHMRQYYWELEIKECIKELPLYLAKKYLTPDNSLTEQGAVTIFEELLELQKNARSKDDLLFSSFTENNDQTLIRSVCS